MKNSCFFLLLVLALVSCRKQSSFVRQEQIADYTVTHFDIPEQQPLQEPLQLSELVKNARIVPLETTKECLIGYPARYYVGKSYIVVFQESDILLFDAEGHFIRTVARQGKAPSEFGEVRDFGVDEKNELLFILDRMAQTELKYFHLKDSTVFGAIETIEAKNNSVECLENGNLLLAPLPYGNVNYYFYQQTPEGKLGENLPYRSNKKVRPVFKRLLYRVNDELRYLSSEDMFSDDTVFHVTARNLQPTWVFHYDASKHYKVLGETPEYLFFKFSILMSQDESLTTGGEAKVVMMNYDEHTFFYDKKNGKLAAIEGVVDDYFSGKIWPFENLQIQQGNTLYIVMPAMNLYGENVMKTDDKMSVRSPEVWQGILKKYSEEDNPILLIADLNRE